MFVYWVLFLLIAFQAISRVRPSIEGRRWPGSWRAVFVLLVLLIGLRHEVGGDWAMYEANLELVRDTSLLQAVAASRDPADGIFNWAAVQTGLDIYFVNCVYAVLFTFGLLVFCRDQPRPWLALTVAVPYLITVVAMGYSRQGVAIGLVMLGMVALERNQVFKFVLWVALAAVFHKSAVIIVPLAVLASTRKRLLTVFWVGVSTVFLYGLLLQEHVDSLISGYIVDKYDSSGSGVRIAMNALPGALFLALRERFVLTPEKKSFLTYLALSSIAFIPLLLISPSSTAVDRVALYWIPLQLTVWARVPDVLGRTTGALGLWTWSVVVYSAAVYFVWLFFADYSVYWLPYKFYPWIWLWQ
jgi:hypothetical protein